MKIFSAGTNTSRSYFQIWALKLKLQVVSFPGACFSKVPKLFGSLSGPTIAVIAVAPTDRASFVYSYVQTRLKGQYNGKWPFSLVYVLKPLIIAIRAIPFTSSQRRGSKLSNFVSLFVFLTLKTREKISFSKQADCSLTTGFWAQKVLGTSRNGPLLKNLDFHHRMWRQRHLCDNSLHFFPYTSLSRSIWNIE